MSNQLGGPPPLNQPFLQQNGLVSSIWQLWLLAVMVEFALGIGNGAAAPMLAPALGTGSGPNNPNEVVNFAQFQATDGKLYWIPLFQ